jgi:type IV pilus assembly protein PilN
VARINLLPWREAERRRRQREVAATTASALAATLALGFAVHLYLNLLVSDQESRNQFLQHEISLLDEKIREIRDLEKTRERLLARMNVIQQLQVSRPEVVHLFDELVMDIPAGVYLTKISQTGRFVILDGRAQSNARVSAFMRNIEASKWLGNPALMLIEYEDTSGTGMSHFRLRFEQLESSGEEATAS